MEESPAYKVLKNQSDKMMKYALLDYVFSFQ